MKIVNICPTSTYNVNWGYQDNLLPKYQAKLGHEVTILATNLIALNGARVETNCEEFVLDSGVKVIRIKRKKSSSRFLTGIKAYLPIYEHLKQIKPDFIFHHGLCSDCIYDAIKYKKKINPNCVIVQDNHLDYNIGFKQGGFKYKLYKAIHGRRVKKTIGEVERVYGVTPWRVKYAEDFFGVPKEKLELLIMGADDENLNFSNREEIRKEIRAKYNVSEKDFLIVTGGKIDQRKRIHLLMQAVKNLEGVKLIVFGNVLDDVKEEFDKTLKGSSNIEFIGWLKGDKVYDYFFASDLVCFPGQHSVLWEQACASKTPCVFEKWDGMEHVNNGGNSDFIENVSVQTILDKILELKFTDKYYKMKEVALSSKTDVYLYSNIAEKSIERAK